MAWVKFSDDFATHPKIVALSHPAYRLWTSSIAYANRHATNGIITRSGLNAIPYSKPRTAVELEEAGLWHKHPDGWRIHDYEKYQPTSAEQEAKRTAHAEQMREWRAAKKAMRDRSRDASRDTNVLADCDVT